MGTTPSFASASEALDMVLAGLRFLADADAAQMAAGEQAGCLQRLEQVTSVVTAARSSVLGGFTAGKGYSADADYSPRAWLIHKTGVTRGAAVSYTAWAKRAVAHPAVFAVLAAGDVSESFARTVCVWTDKLPAGSRDKADAILMGAAVAGLSLPGLAGNRRASPVTAARAGTAPVRTAGMAPVTARLASLGPPGPMRARAAARGKTLMASPAGTARRMTAGMRYSRTGRCGCW